jgi:succinyl-CoA synthetase beta subunit
MNLHEFQFKELFSQYAIPIPRGRTLATLRNCAVNY